MIRYIEGDMFKSPAQVLVNTVNTVGVMGKGVALEFKKRYPDMFQAYREVCDKRKLKIGTLMLFYEPDHWVLLFPTKENWRNPSRIEYIEAGLAKFRRTYAEKGITSVAFPRLGCGNGELNWSDVQPVMEKFLQDLPIDVYVYLGMGTDPFPEHKNQEKTVDWLRHNAKDMSFQGLEDDIRYNCSIVPYHFSSDRSDWCVLWKEGLAFEKNGKDKEQVLVDEDSFFEIWSDLRSNGIAARGTAVSPERLVMDLLLSLGYLSEIRISDGKTGEKTEGYQINSGEGRVYDLKGRSDELSGNHSEK
ncbi:macro domain-containing protein [Stecheria intestinalis]|uniref:macro domain-containing protein n=1 Tax=Stecheria intestinalis TaxID=2606630 RepID=UPI0023F24E1E|nr:macro domain-containing protein [Stecheria intestinalis]MCI6744776.1 macro domain-containing protein [Anaerolactibacter massiliensis]MDD5882013.1 macro domain-containing protein [Stecheria intestinalis]